MGLVLVHLTALGLSLLASISLLGAYSLDHESHATTLPDTAEYVVAIGLILSGVVLPTSAVLARHRLARTLANYGVVVWPFLWTLIAVTFILKY